MVETSEDVGTVKLLTFVIELVGIVRTAFYGWGCIIEAISSTFFELFDSPVPQKNLFFPKNQDPLGKTNLYIKTLFVKSL